MRRARRAARKEIRWPFHAATVVAASRGYPSGTKGLEIYGLQDIPSGATVFHAGTKKVDGNGNRRVTSGGRVLAVTATAENLRDAVRSAYEGTYAIHFDGMQYRFDIAARALPVKDIPTVKIGVLGSTRGTDCRRFSMRKAVVA